MRIGIHQSDASYSRHWVEYCKLMNIPYKIVNCYSSDIIHDLSDCDMLMWHHNHANPKDLLFAKELIYSLETAGKLVYPDAKTTWFFNDKLGQKYLLEAMQFPLIPTFVFFSKREAMDWISKAIFPIVFKLRSGAGSRNVRLVKDPRTAKRLIKYAFGRGIRQYNALGGLLESLRKYRKGRASLKTVFKSVAHFVYPIQLEKSEGRHKGYIYFQEFIPDCKYDIRIQSVGDKIWAMTRTVRKGDFRASGSGDLNYDPKVIPVEALQLSKAVSEKLSLQSMAIDLLPYKNGFLIAEVSYAFGVDPEELEVGYWDKNLEWHAGRINPFAWMVEDLISRYNAAKSH